MKKLLIKITGELFSYQREPEDGSPALKKEQIDSVVTQIKTLNKTCNIGLVIGGGNFFRGALSNDGLQLKPSSAHTIGMLSTMVNGIVFHDILTQAGIPTVILSAVSCPNVAQLISQKTIEDAFAQRKCVIFVGGTGNPFFTTDTNAVLRALQIGADEVWKATKVDGVYDSDPHKAGAQATRYPTISYKEVLDKNLAVIDKTAVTLAQEHNLAIRVFDIFAPSALQNALENPAFGSRINKRPSSSGLNPPVV